MPPKEPLAARFARKLVRRNGCLEYVGATRNGYGAVMTAYRSQGTRRTEYAHRIAWMAARGPIPDGMCVCHRCDNRLCCDVAHMFLGTVKENHLDMVRKGRWAGHEPLRPKIIRMGP